jgi:hypothetical protein
MVTLSDPYSAALIADVRASSLRYIANLIGTDRSAND